ncbi:MAG: HU family DNA-binding protein [Lachnospiraceae bacterium]|nr:HU family DNA-binding protein [Lachnospiraceae bacterium]
MSKEELVGAIAQKTQLTNEDAESALKAFLEVVTDELKNEDSECIKDFASFDVEDRKQ